MLTSAQLQVLKAAIIADPAINALPNTPDDNFAIATYFNQFTVPDFWVWRTNVSRQDVYNTQNDLSVSGAQTGFWNWTTYKNQTAAEQNAWTQIFMGDQADFSKKNVRDGVAAIFTGSAGANAQRDHCLAIGRRKATRAENLFAAATPGGSGTPGIATNPATMVVEGNLQPSDVSSARDAV